MFWKESLYNMYTYTVKQLQKHTHIFIYSYIYNNIYTKNEKIHLKTCTPQIKNLQRDQFLNFQIFEYLNFSFKLIC